MRLLGPLPAQFSMPGMGEWVIIAIIGLLLFGKRLPEVGRSLGKGIVEFKKGLRGIEDEVEQAVDRRPVDTETPRLETHQTPPPTAERHPEKTEVHPGD